MQLDIALWHTKLCFHVQIEHSTRMSHVMQLRMLTSFLLFRLKPGGSQGSGSPSCFKPRGATSRRVPAQRVGSRLQASSTLGLDGLIPGGGGGVGWG